MRSSVGAFYFKDLRGETLVAECWRRQRLSLAGSDEDDPFQLALSGAVNRISQTESYASFKEQFEDGSGVTYGDPTVQTAWSLFQKWLTQPQMVAEFEKYLEGFTAVLDYESNRPYEYWYDTPPRLVVSAEIEGLLKSILRDASYAEKEISDYFREVIRPKMPTEINQDI